jgi:hypothetical protein
MRNTMARTIIIGDIHGCADELRLLLEKVQPAPEDIVISLGDVTDKGPDSKGAIHLLMKYNAAFVLGNHDDRYVRYFKKGLSADEVNAKKIADKYKDEYAKLAGTPELAWLAANATLYTEVEVLGQLFTFVHAGVVPYIDIYNPKKWHIGEALRVRYLDADTKGFIRMVKIDKEKYPDEVASWKPEHDNVVEWQREYDGRYGIVVHGHIIIGPNPKFWLEQFDGSTEQFELTGATKDNPIELESLVVSKVKAISLDTGAHKGWNLTAMIIEEDSGDIYFEQVEVETCYEP